MPRQSEIEIGKRSPSAESGSTNRASQPDASFSWPIRVYWEDTDAGGIVYYANYLKFMERARTEWLRALGIEQGPLRDEQRLMFVIVDTQVEFKKPARYGDALIVTAHLADASRASLRFRQEVLRGQELLVAGSVRVACLDAESYRPRGLPRPLIEQLTRRSS